MAINWTQIYKNYKGLWVALSDDEKTVISAAKNAKNVISMANKKGVPNPILTKVPSKIVPLAG